MKFAASVLALAASASAHMVMEFPKPYGNPNNSPLENSGADFPCKATGPESYVITEMNVWNAGETQNVRFKGGATHGGGSCQFSLTDDMAPTKESAWKVVHSVIGGCPSSHPENYNDDASNQDGLSTYPITLPADLPAGEYTFAWTWFNKIGNREMYMNCAPIKVGAAASVAAAAEAKSVSDVLGNLPDMFVSNIPREQCSTSEGQDFVFPNLGDSVEYGEKAVPGTAFSETAGCATMTGMGAGNGQLGSPAQPTGQPAVSETPSGDEPTPTPTPPAVPSNPGGIFAPGASSAAPSGSAPAPTATAAPAPSAAPTGTPVYSPPEDNTPPPKETTPPKDDTPPSTGAPASGDGVPCDTDGAIVCIGDSQFGLCNWGVAVPQDLAAGTTCSNGVIAKRSIRFPRAYLHRRHASGVL